MIRKIYLQLVILLDISVNVLVHA